MEDEHNVEHGELFAGNRQRQANKDRVEDDAELEDEDARQLRSVLLRSLLSRCRVVMLIGILDD